MNGPEKDPWAFQRWAFETTVGNATRKAILMALATMAGNETGRCEVKVETLARYTEASPKTVREHLGELAKRGVIDRKPQFRADRGRRSDEFLLLAPWITGWPDGTPLPNPPGGTHSPVEGGTPLPSGTAQEQPLGNNRPLEDARADNSGGETEFPSDLPSELHDVAVAAGKILKRTALTRKQKKEVTRASVGHAVMSYPDRDHVAVAHDLEAWLLHGKGAGRECRDIVARFRNFLQGSEPMAGPPLAPGVVPMHGRGSGQIAQLHEMADSLRQRGL